MSDGDPVSDEMPQTIAGAAALERVAKVLGMPVSNFYEQSQAEVTEAANHTQEAMALLHLVQAYLRRSKAEGRRSFSDVVRAMADEEPFMPVDGLS